MKNENPLCNAHLSVSDIFVSLFLAIAFVISSSCIRDEGLVLSLNGILWCLLYFAVFLIFAAVTRSVLEVRASVRIVFFEKLLNGRHAQAILTVLMFLFWLPSLIVLYPGTVINDTWNQLAQFIRMFHEGKVYLSVLWDHHPVFATFVMGQIIVPVANLTGNWSIAIFIYVIGQSILTCLAFSYTLVYMHRTLKTGTGFVAAVFCIYCLLPIFPASVQTVSKDSLCAWIFVLFSVHFIEMLRTDGISLSSSYNRDVFFLLILACCATKKVSFYVIFLSLLAGLLTIHKNRKSLLVVILLITVLMQLIWPLFMKVTGIGPGGKQEMLSIPFQQTARYVKEHPNDITEEEYAVLDKLLTMSTLAERYDPISADPVKGYSERGNTADYIEYLKVWFMQGLRHPGTYFRAFLAMEAGWFSWTEYAPLMNMDWHIQLDSSVIPPAAAERPEPFSKWAEDYQKFYDAIYRIPALKYLFTYGLYAALIPAFVFSTLIYRFKKVKGKRNVRALLSALTPAAPMIFSLILGCWLAPVSIHFEGRRYLFPITYTALLLLAWCRYSLIRGGDTIGKNGTDSGIDSML